MFPLNLPIVLQDGIVAALFAASLAVMIYRRLKKKPKSCPACPGECGTADSLSGGKPAGIQSVSNLN